MNRSIKNGFTLIDALLSLMVTSIVCFIGVVFIETCMNVIALQPLSQNQLAILQLRQICALSDNLSVEDGSLKMIYQNEEIILQYDRNRLVQMDGYEIWMEGLNDCSFYEQDEEIYLSWTFNGKEYHSQIY